MTADRAGVAQSPGGFSVSARVLNTAGVACASCLTAEGAPMSGKVTSGERRRRQIAHLVARDGAWCHWCFAVFLDPQAEATRDHLIPRSRGGGNHIGNLVLACSDCNQARGAPEFDAALVELFVARGWAARDPA